ncbi:MAG: bifunctional 23S rRNA (guanine(2069)-N(7))-methyltransferase RlmK/23S rRNA (guanine(2445)-N(2))-methyltransferase RlmL [Pirellulales bacterium]
MPKFDLLAVTAFGIEAVTARELNQLGYKTEIIGSGRVLFHGDESDIVRTNLWLRTADRVLIRVGHFAADDFGLLFDQTKALPWHEWLPADAEFPVNGRSHKSQLSSVPACQRMVKKAVVDKLLEAHDVEELPESGSKYTLEVAILKDEVTLTIDTTGVGLHKRGYRTLVGEAPLKETLAAALIQLSYWNRDRTMIDPFCGSGTIPIEAAMIGRNIAPGLRREFSSEAWPKIPAELWQQARDDAKAQQLPGFPQAIIGYDIDREALKLARFHAEQAGVGEDIHWQQKDFRDFTNRRKYGCVITNPPYGERIGESRELEELYATFPDVLRGMPTWSHYVLTAKSRFEQLIGRQADRRRKIFNARIECQYYSFFGPVPPKNYDPTQDTDSEPEDIVETDSIPLETPAEETEQEPRKRRTIVPAFGQLSGKADEQAELFRSRLVKRARHLRRWPGRGIHCYRLYERDIPELPFVVDKYHDCLHITEYDRPHERTIGEHGSWVDLMAKTAGEALEVPQNQVFVKRKDRQRGATQHEKVDKQSFIYDVEEDGLKFQVNLSDYVDTGLFLDHRITRKMVREEAEGKHFLNLFAYTGSFSVYAAAGGAASTTTVDLSPTYTSWAQRNLKINGFGGNAHRLVQADVMAFLQSDSSDKKYDIAVMDVPTFSNSKRTEEVWDVQQDYIQALSMLIARMADDGVIYFATNYRRFKLDEELLQGMKVREISKKTVPEDFRNKRIHRCWRMICSGK